MYRNAGKINLELDHNKIGRMPHPAYSPDISPYDFWLFRFLKEKFKEQELSTSDERIEAMMTICNDVTLKELQSMFSERIQQVTWVIERGRGITTNDCFSFLKEFSLVEKPGAVRTFWNPYSCNFHLRPWEGTRLESLCSLYQQHRPIPLEITLFEFHFLTCKCNLAFFHQNFEHAMELFEWNYNIYSCFSTKSQGGRLTSFFCSPHRNTLRPDYLTFRRI
jgi:hypothetical protein